MSHEHAPGIVLDEALPTAARTGERGAVVHGCTSDWRRVRPGDAYVAVLGDEDDGHHHVADAVRRGAAAVIVEQPVPVFSTPVYQVRDTALDRTCAIKTILPQFLADQQAVARFARDPSEFRATR